jgi:4-amino-4-deoxy-L-arabinose transferase-like glycosyltransferase
MRYWPVLSTMCVLAFFGSTYALLSHREIGWDSALYLEVAEYWYGGNPAFRNLSLSPLLSLIEYAIFLVFGINILAVKIFYAAFLPGLIFSVYKLTSLFENQRAGLLAGSLVGLNSTVAFWSTRLYTDIPAIFLFVTGLWLFLKAHKVGSGRYYLLAGLTFGLSTLMRVPSVTLLGLIGIYVLVNRQFDVKILLLASALLPLIAWLAYLQIEMGDGLYALKSYLSGLVSTHIDWLRNVHTFVTAADPVWIGLVGLGALAIPSLRDVRWIAFIFSLVLFLAMPFGDVRYAIPALIFGSVMAGASLRFRQVRTFIPLCLCLIASLNLPRLAMAQSENFYCSHNSALIRVGEFLKRNSEPGTVIFAENWWPQIEFWSKRDVYAMVEEKPWLDELIEEMRTRYILTTRPEPRIKYLKGFSLIEEFRDRCRVLWVWKR